MEQQEVRTASSARELNRRRFLGAAAGLAAAAAVPSRLSAAPAAKRLPERVLSFFNTHTGERLRTAYCCGGVYQPDALKEINHILRDFRVNAVKPIDPKLLDLLHELGGTLETDQPFHIISGYRSPHTNAALRERGGAGTGVASRSLHMVGKAIAIGVPGGRLDTLPAARGRLSLGAA